MKCISTAALAAAGLFATACDQRSREAATAPEAASATSATAEPAPGPGEPTLAQVKQLTEKYKDVKVALAEGYVRDPFDLCDTADMVGKPKELGVMGVHYFRPDLVGVTAPPNPRVDGDGMYMDFRQPSILIYEPQADGSMQLVAVENLVWEKTWKDAGKTEPPTFHGLPYEFMADDPATPADEGHKFAPHYDKHLWIYRDNPNGVYAPFNPAATCEHHTGAKMPSMPGMPAAPAKP
jgi:hypothetical protein